jgi:predicted GNAT family N-acyltransferase
MALKQIDHGSKEYHEMLRLRRDILRKPLGLDLTDEDLEKDKHDILIGAFEEDKLLGCCQLTKIDEETLRLRQMAVPKEMQGKGIGRVMIQFAENLARDLRYKKMIMHARSNVTGFYEKQGYRICSDEFLEVTIPHYVMEKRLI